MNRDSNLHHLNLDKSFEGTFELIYSEYFEPLYLYARSLAKSDDIAKDAVSEVFFSLWKSKHDLSQVKKLKPYLFRSVKNQVIRILMYDPRGFDTLDSQMHVKFIERVSPEEILLEKELVTIIEVAVKRLPDQCRLIFDMAKNDQMSYAEIAKELDVSQSTVKTQVSRAISVIKEVIEQHYQIKSPKTWIGLGMVSVLVVSLLIT